MASVLELSKKINKAWKQDVLTDGTILPETKRVSLGSLGADYPLFGGLPRGAVTVFAGLEHSGKTLAAVQAMANYQKEEPNSTCIYVDGEQALVSQIGFLTKMTCNPLSSVSSFTIILNCFMIFLLHNRLRNQMQIGTDRHDSFFCDRLYGCNTIF